MAQAGIHALVGMVVRKSTGRKEWLLFGILLGSLIPDMDNVGVAAATLMKAPIEGIHRTATHSLFFVVAVIIVFYLLGLWKKDARWTNLGFGLGIGTLLHILLDLLIWFNGVQLLWPLAGEVNFWAKSAPPEWFMKFMDPAEFLFIGLYLWALGTWARGAKTDGDFMKTHRVWLILQFVLFAIFTPLAYFMTKGFLTIFGALYLFSLFMAFFVTIRMRKTIEAAV